MSRPSVDNPSFLKMLALSLWCLVKCFPAVKTLKMNYWCQQVYLLSEKGVKTEIE